MVLGKQPSSNRRAQHKREAARELRANATECEQKLWALLRAKQFAGLRFRRQQPLGLYIADFYCSAARLVIELDGSQHGTDESLNSDAARTAWLVERGYRVLRFSNEEFLKQRDAVIDAISRSIVETGIPLPEPPSAVRPSLKGRVD
jgi:very-short-patch-repair endonuclease